MLLRLCRHVYQHNIWPIMSSPGGFASVITLISLFSSSHLILNTHKIFIDTYRQAHLSVYSYLIYLNINIQNLRKIHTRLIDDRETGHSFCIFSVSPCNLGTIFLSVGWLVFKGVAGCYGDAGIRKCKCQLS